MVCPLCQKDYLLQNFNVIFCRCGARIDSQFGSLTLEQLQHRLTEVVFVAIDHAMAACGLFHRSKKLFRLLVCGFEG